MFSFERVFRNFLLDALEGKVIWSNIPKGLKNVVIRGPRLEFRPFLLQNHQQYKCTIRSFRSNEILRTLTFDSSSNIKESIQLKPNINLTIDSSTLEQTGEIRLICKTG